ncbi:carbohydrate kinase [Mesobaculum littorinae]|uniref:Carbohydrate kinase n=1 Tax=Mesobaculum littorinae TaxID=2486419 RepID=A0A438AIK6_9RHOB|nr:carbohydrate kinase [Mesobaculum littorinae]RVV98591.1 carbohydrate kinase [Mesobaculum littorinae]
MILCSGEALIDMLPRVSERGEPAFAPYSGGAVFNTAIALGRLGAPVSFFSGLSTDLFGAQLIAALDASGVSADRAARSDRPTTLAFVQLAEGQARYAFYDEGTAGRMLRDTDLPQVGPEIAAAFFGGISLAVEPCGTAYETLMLELSTRASGPVTMIDPNVRPGFVADEPAYRARIGRMIAAADIVKISDEDLHWLEGPGDPAALARGMLGGEALANDAQGRGPRLVCLTRGAEGALGVTEADEVFVPARKVEVVDTVGAGDTFNAGVLAGLNRAGVLSRAGLAGLSREDIEAALSLGIRAAAVTVSRAGANPPWSEEL